MLVEKLCQCQLLLPLFIIAFVVVLPSASVSGTIAGGDSCGDCHDNVHKGAEDVRQALFNASDYINGKCERLDLKLLGDCIDQMRDISQSLLVTFADGFSALKICKHTCSRRKRYAISDADDRDPPCKCKSDSESKSSSESHSQSSSDSQSQERRVEPPSLGEEKRPRAACSGCQDHMNDVQMFMREKLIYCRKRLSEACSRVDTMVKAECFSTSKQISKELSDKFERSFSPRLACQSVCGGQD